MKILFYLRLVQVRRALPNSGSDSGVAARRCAPFKTLGNCQPYCNIVLVIPPPSSIKNSAIYFLTHLFDFC